MAQDSEVRPLPYLAPLHYLDERNPKEIWKYCNEKQAEWVQKRSLDHKLSCLMEEYKKQRALNMVWLGNKLEGTLPDGVSQKATFKVLKEIYSLDADYQLSPQSNDENQGSDNDAEKHRKTMRQLAQHMKAFKVLCKNEAVLSPPLTDVLVKRTHQVLMDGLKTEDGKPISSGEYRQGPVHAGPYSFPSHDCIPSGMKKILAEYNKKAADPSHDIYDLASWLLLKFVTLHPFEDGNGRMCRLLWCYSLMKDGLPFPLTISSGHSKAHGHYVKEIEADRRSLERGHLATLTLMSVRDAWINFDCNLEFELVEDESKGL